MNAKMIVLVALVAVFAGQASAGMIGDVGVMAKAMVDTATGIMSNPASITPETATKLVELAFKLAAKNVGFSMEDANVLKSAFAGVTDPAQLAGIAGGEQVQVMMKKMIEVAPKMLTSIVGK
ncbi:hypothetical protein HDE_03760 [Halotydeus destructor]|nr:hypothetical protein HDE_03760 [Halotydeus destructor]